MATQIIKIDDSKAKYGVDQAIDMLQEMLGNEGYEVTYISSGLREFCEQEAEFRLFDAQILSDDIQDRVNALNDDERETLIYHLSEEFFEREGLIDCDWVDEVTREVVEKELEELEEERRRR